MLDPEYLEWSGDGRELLFNRLSSLTSNYFENALVERALWRYDTRSDMSMEVAPESSVESSQAGIAGTGARNKGIAYRMAIANSNRYATITSGGKATVARWNTANSQFDIIAPGAIYASTRTGVIIRSFTPEGVMFHYADDSGQVKQLTGINRIEQQAASPLGFKEEGKVMTSQAGPVAAFSSSWKLPFAGAARLNQGGQLFSDGGCDGRACSIVSHGGPLGYALDLGQTAPQGPLRILAPEEGTVVAVVKDVTCNSIQPACNVGWDNYSQSCPNIGGSGNHVAIAHPDGSFSFYAHMRSFSSPLTVGQVVLQGDHLGDQGHSGSTGGASGGTMPPCGDHIHFQRQLSAAVWAQSIPTDFVELPCQLSCLTNYISQNIDRADSPATSSLTLILAPIAAVAGNTYPSHRVVLPAPAPVGGTMVSLSSSSPEIVLPASVSVPEGASFASFPITATPAASPSTVLITAQDGAQTATATLNVVPIGISSLVLSPTTVVGGSTTPNNELTLTHLAVHGASVEMSSTTPVAMPPSSLNIPAGSSFAGFPIVTAQTPTAVTATISATFGTSVKAADLQITALVLQSLTLGAVQVVGGGAVPGNRVVLNSAAGPGGAVVNLSSSDPTVALVPTGITVDAGATQSAAFSISTAAVTNPTTVTVTASYNGVNRSANLTVNPVALSSVSLGSATVVGGNTIQGNRVNLDFLAGPTEIAVTLSTSDASRATVPPSIVVPAGSIQSPEFTVSTFPVTATTTVNLIATYNGITKIAVITLNPVVPSSLTLGASTALGGETVPNNTVTLAGAAPGGGAVVILTSSNTAIAQVPANVTVPAGATVSPAFSIITSSVTASASVTITATYSGASVAATLTITPATAGTSLLAAYGFNEGSGGTTADSSGNGHTATLVGATWTTGKYGNGLAFNGTNQYATGTDIDFPSGPFTVSGWFKTTIQNSGRTMISKYLSGTNQFYIILRQSGGILAGFYDGTDWQEVATPQSYADNNWHHFAVAVSTSTVELFVDGVKQGTDTHDNSLPVNNVVWNMGRASNNTSYFQGSLDEIKFYNKALTAAEVIDDMNTPVGGAPLPDTTPPVVSNGSPNGALPAGTTSAAMSLVTNEAATCKWGVSPGTAYTALPNIFTTTNGLNHTTTVGSLSDGTSYAFYARCQDAANNANTMDYAISFNVSNAPVPGSGLLAAYGFNEGSGGTTADSSGNGHTATLVGATWTTGKYGNGLAFNGTNQYATGTDIDFPSGPFTVSGWFKTTIQNNPQTIVSKYLSGTNQIYVLIRGSGGTPAGGILAGFHDGVNLRTVSPSQSYADNTWHHFAMVVTTSTLELFVDGVSKGTAPHGNSFPVNNVVWNMGRTANSTFYFQGSLDEIKFYNKALTAAEIIDDMNTPV